MPDAQATAFSGKDEQMEELNSITISEERLADRCDVIEPELKDLIRCGLRTGFSREEILRR
jgi:hypothetical protein